MSVLGLESRFRTGDLLRERRQIVRPATPSRSANSFPAPRPAPPPPPATPFKSHWRLGFKRNSSYVPTHTIFGAHRLGLGTTPLYA
ncbi:hypothetical protein JYU34_000713 [Plutella xylostella]|uniref:Uncharacterized protein n=1 Tax=Plutella xylostella TaxID=51655 RepID=A0ABQ7R8C2_PLUXY|nr:hypothetical protein JYU34_000713 [Plutella xylostella]